MRNKTLGMVAAVMTFAQVAAAQTAAEIQTWNTTWAQYQAIEAIPAPQRGLVTASQDLTIVINGRINEIFDIYSNVYNAIGLHPFLASITDIRNTRDAFDFIAYENIPLPDGSIFPGVTVAQQRFDRRHHVYYSDTYDFPGIITHQTVTFTRVGRHQVQVTEHLVFEAPAVYIQTAVQGGVYAHYAVQQGLKAKIEAHQLRPIPFPRYLPNPTRGCEHGDDDDDNDD